MMVSVYGCLEAWWKYGYEIEYFWISGILVVFVGVFGLIGNIANLIVLWKIEFRKKVFYKLLIALAFCDILLIVSYGITTSYQSLACLPTNDNVGYFTFYFYKIATIGSEYVTIAISLERYIGICHPHFRFSRCLAFYLVPVILITTFVNAPILFERQYHVVNDTIVSSQHEWATSNAYKIYANTVSFIFQSVIPLTALLFLNGILLYNIISSSKSVKAISRNASYSQKSTTKILLYVVINSLICHGLRIAYKSLYLSGCPDEQESPEEDCVEKRDEMRRWNFIAPIEKLAYMFNSSVNFLIFCLVGKHFRTVFCRIFSIQKLQNPNTILTNDIS